MDAEETAAAGDELEQVAAQRGIGERIADGVVEKDGVETAEGFAFENGGIVADDGFIGTGLLAHEGERGARVRDGSMAGVADVEREDE